jgi:hypothetical protein
MGRALATFVGGVIVGAGVVVTSGHLAGFQRPVPPVRPPVVAEPVQRCATWAEYEAVERGIPKDLQECVGREMTGDHHREMGRFQDRMKWSLERAVGTCVAMRKTPPSVTRR